METTNKARALQIAKGSFQKNLILGRETLGGSTLKGKAKMYTDKYKKSGYSLIANLKANGIPYEIEKGENGEYYSARLIILEDESLD